MPSPCRRSRSKKRVSKTLPGGRRTVHYNRGATSTPHCNLCGQPMGAVTHLSTAEIRKLNQTKRTISRFYGGELCPECLKRSLKQAVRTP